MAVLEVRNLKKSFDKDTVVLRGVDFSLEKGETVAIIGSSGSGKTRFWLKPNLMQCTSKRYPVSFVVTDPNGYTISR